VARALWTARSPSAGQYDDGPLLRHTRNTAIRRLTDMGVPIPRVMQMVGHKTLTMNMLYNVATEDDLDLIREKYDGAQPKQPRGKVRIIRKSGSGAV
jgi:predicted amino acid-binding ACT domain protein